MDDFRTIQDCPACGSADVPNLIVRSGIFDDNGLSWRCRQCHQEWPDASVGAHPEAT
jgi:formate dehydrogenase maturation protein FdhE